MLFLYLRNLKFEPSNCKSRDAQMKLRNTNNIACIDRFKVKNCQSLKKLGLSTELSLFSILTFTARKMSVFGVLSPDAGKYGPENLRIQTLFEQWLIGTGTLK